MSGTKPEISFTVYDGSKPIQSLDSKVDSKLLVSNNNTTTKKVEMDKQTDTLSVSDNSKISLSSPTKWKWSFSEIQDPSLIKPVSPILKLHNFQSEESDTIKDSVTESVLSKATIDSPSSAQEKTTEVENRGTERSGLFSYLFEITNVTKLSPNVTSEEDDLPNNINSKNYLNSYTSNNSVDSNLTPSTLMSLAKSNISNEPPETMQVYHSTVVSSFPEKVFLNENDDKESFVDAQSSMESQNLYSIFKNKTSIGDSKKDVLTTSQETCKQPSKKESHHKVNYLLEEKLKILSSEDEFFDASSILENEKLNKTLTFDPKVNARHGDSPSINNVCADKTKLLNNIDIDEIIRRHATSEHFNAKNMISSDIESSTFTESEYTDNDSIMTDITEEPSVISDNFTLDKKRSIFSLSENNLALDYPAKSGLQDLISQLPSHSMINDSIKVFTKGISLDETLLDCKLPIEELAPHSPRDSFSSALSNKSLGSLASTSLIFTKQSANSSSEELSLGSDISLDNIDLKRICFSETLQSMSIDTEIQAAEKALIAENEDNKNKINVAMLAQNSSEESFSELINRKLWAGVKSLSLDAEVLIATDKSEKSCLDFSSSSLPILEESPISESSKDAKKSILFKNTDDYEINKQKMLLKRRNSEAALKLMKENTKIIDKILNHRHEKDSHSSSSDGKYELPDDSKVFLKRRASSDHSIANSIASLESMVNEPLPKEKNGNSETYSLTDQNHEKTQAWDSTKAFFSKSLEDPNNSRLSDISVILDQRKESNRDAASFLTEYKFSLPKDKKLEEYNYDQTRQKELSSLSYDAVDKRIESKIDHTAKSLLSFSPSLKEIKSEVKTDKTQFESAKEKDVKSYEIMSKSMEDCGEKDTYKPFLTSKYFTSILATSDDRSETESFQSASLDIEKTDASSMSSHSDCNGKPKVPFSKLSRLSPKSTDRKLQVVTSNSEKANRISLVRKTPQAFNPFPTKPLNRPPKEVGIKLGLYSRQTLL